MAVWLLADWGRPGTPKVASTGTHSPPWGRGWPGASWNWESRCPASARGFSSGARRPTPTPSMNRSATRTGSDCILVPEPMALHGDLFSYPLPELLQWLDGSRKTGTLQLSWEAGERKIFVLSGQVVATASRGLRERVARLLELAKLCQGSRVLTSFEELQRTPDAEAAFSAHGVDVRMVREMGREELFSSMMDLTIAGRGTFHWTEDADRT